MVDCAGVMAQVENGLDELQLAEQQAAGTVAEEIGARVKRYDRQQAHDSFGE